MAKKYPKTGKELIRLAEKSEQVASIRPGKGSHLVVTFKNGTHISIPMHGNQDLDTGLRHHALKVFKAAGVLVLLLVLMGITSFAFGVLQFP